MNYAGIFYRQYYNELVTPQCSLDELYSRHFCT